MPNTSVVAFAEECTVIISREAFTVFVLVTESGDRPVQSPQTRVVGLRVQRATGLRNPDQIIEISSAKIENCLSGSR